MPTRLPTRRSKRIKKIQKKRENEELDESEELDMDLENQGILLFIRFGLTRSEFFSEFLNLPEELLGEILSGEETDDEDSQGKSDERMPCGIMALGNCLFFWF